MTRALNTQDVLLSAARQRYKYILWPKKPPKTGLIMISNVNLLLQSHPEVDAKCSKMMKYFHLHLAGVPTRGKSDSRIRWGCCWQVLCFPLQLLPRVTMKPPALGLLSLLFCLSRAANKHRPRSAAARGQNETTVWNKAAGEWAP